MPSPRIPERALASRRMLLDLPPPARPARHEPLARDTGRPSSRGRDLRRLLVATDGSPSASGALSLARQLSVRHGASLSVVTVIDRWGPPEASGELVHLFPELAAQRLSIVQPQVEEALGQSIEWQLRVVDGPIVPTLSAVADAGGYDLLVIGMGPRWLRRLQPRPTAAAVAQRSRAPVLAVPANASSLPTRALLRVQREAGSMTAATASLHLLEPWAEAQLVYVPTRRRPRGTPDVFRHRVIDPAPVFYEFERALGAHRRGVPAPVELSRLTLSAGDPAVRLVDHARRTGADLIVTGIDRPVGIADRLRGGSASRLLRLAECTVLLAGGAASSAATVAVAEG